MDDDIKNLKEMEKELDSIDTEMDEKLEPRRSTAMASRDREGSHAWVPGLILVGLGAFFLLRNFTDFRLDNWWALFILIPAFGSLGNFRRAYQRSGRINGEARGSLIGGLILLFVAAIFLFGWNWGAVWPVFLIIAGVGALLSGLLG